MKKYDFINELKILTHEFIAPFYISENQPYNP